MNGYLFYNHFDLVYGGYGWLEFKPNNKLAMCRIAEEADRDGQCKRCHFSMKPHFLVEETGGVYVKLCTVDVIRFKPIDFRMTIFGADPRPEQLTLWD